MSEVTREEFNALTERVNKLEEGKSFGKAARIKRTSRAKRAPSAYNLFMKTEVPKVKKKNPNMSHTDAFTAAAKRWGKQKH